MKQNIARDAENYMKNHRKKGRWYKLVTGLACIVVFCTTYALILPAITLEGNQCGIEEHTHTDECYTQVTSITRKVPVCTVEGLDIHVHSEKCYDDQKNLICGYADFVAHKHDASCYREDGTLWCPLEEREPHVHDASCYTLPEPHVHTDECYTTERGELTCTEHVHTDECYTETTGLTCGLEESEAHHHDDSCHDAEGNLVCGQEESEGHHHSESCYGPVRTLNCGHEGDHQHTDACYEQKKVLTCELSTDPVTEPVLVCDKEEILLHPHTEECYDKDGKRICGQVEIKEHKHIDACFREEQEPVDTETLTCTLPEDENHTHTARCYGTWELTCGKEAHTHTLACYADPEADLETEADWKQPFADLALTGKWREDLLSLAKTQLGYAESERNYIVLEDGETTKGYTRYGAWQDDPYMDWNAAFVSFCLHYAGVTEIPVSADCAGWPGALGEQYAPADAREPVPGDLVFFDRDSDGSADHVGILLEVTEGTEEEPAVFTTIEGDAENAVRKADYPSGDPTVLGYGILPEQAKTFTLTATTESGITVTVSGDSASLPCLAGDVRVVVKELDESEQQELDAQLAKNEENQESLESEEEEPEVCYLLDVSLWRGETEIQPEGPVTVTFSGFETEGLYPQVYHIDTDANTATDMEAVTDEDGNVSLETNHFCPFKAIMRTAPNGTTLSGQLHENSFDGSGTFRLDDDAYISDTVKVENRNITLDLAGHGLYYQGGSSLFEVKNGGTLTIEDSGAVDETETTVGNQYGHLADLKKTGNMPTKLIYYVTESAASGISTTETTKMHEVTPKGFISAETSGAQSIVKVTGGGSFTLQGGLLTNPFKRIVDNDHSIVTISGGYIVGGNVDGDMWGGGGIYSSGTLNMTGGVIAANQASNRGGGVTLNGGTFNMSGGVISGNQTWTGEVGKVDYSTGEGGGIYSNEATLNLSGTAYVTNNCQNKWCGENNRGNGCHGGGGIATSKGTLSMSGGYVTGNYSKEAGGGLYVGHWENGTTFTMTGGIVAGNVSDTSEGGGIRISGGTNAIISTSQYSKVYITHNTNNSDFDWGGGGIFVQESGKLQVFNSLITNNSAGGFGGGVGACPSGAASIAANNGAAIYGNSDEGTNLSKGGGGKNGDVEIANKSSTFKSNGHADVFWVKDNAHSGTISVTGKMLGGSSAGWQGSIDSSVVSIIDPDEKRTASTLLGLTANPPDPDGTGAAIDAAQEKAYVIISGNHSYTHGGGIMTNGGLVIGGTEIKPLPSLNITGTKALLKASGGPEPIREGEFQFQLLDSPKSSTTHKVLGTAEVKTDGTFNISLKESFSKNGTYTYYLSEVTGEDPDITYDQTEHVIEVTIASKSKTDPETNTTYTIYYVESVTVDGKASGSGGSGSTGVFRIHFYNTKGWNPVRLHLFGDNPGKLTNDSEYTTWPGKPINEDPNPGNSGWYTAEFNVSESGWFKFLFDGNENDVQTVDSTSYEFKGGKELWVTCSQNPNNDGKYTMDIADTAPSGWVPSSGDEGGGNEGSGDEGGGFTGTANVDGSYTVDLGENTFTNTKTVTTSISLKLVKTDSDTGEKLSGAKFQLKEANAEGNGEEKEITNADDGVTFAGLKENTTYYLWETQAPPNYYKAGPWILTVGEDGNAKIYDAKPSESDTNALVKVDEKDPGTSLGCTRGDHSIELTTTISDKPVGYELPNTGGTGTELYTLGGLLLIAAAGLLAYSRRKRRKEDFVSF